MQIPGETAAPLIKRLRGAGWSAGGAGWPPGRATPREGAAGGARGGGASRRRPALRHPSERGNCTRDTHVPAGGGWGGREGGWAGGREEPEGGTDGRDRGRAGWVRERGRDEASWWKQRPSTPGPPRSPARQGEPCQGPVRPLLPLTARSPPGTARAGPLKSPRRAPLSWSAPLSLLARGGSRALGSLSGALPGGKPPHKAWERNLLPGDPGWLCPAPSACTQAGGLDAFGPHHCTPDY